MNLDAPAAILIALLAFPLIPLAGRSERRPLPALAVRRPATGAEADRSVGGPAKAQEAPESTGGNRRPTDSGGRRRRLLTSEQLAVSRRQFLNRAMSASFGAFLGVFGMGTLSFLWPTLAGGFGTKITAGNYDELLEQIGPRNNFKPVFFAEGRFWLTYYDGTADSPVYLAINAKEVKMQALYRKCVHLGCSVPHCDTSMLFECPCHGSRYRLNGEYYGGPAPRGLDRFPIAIEGGKVVVDTGALQTGPPRGTNTWDKFAEPVGTFCVPT